MGSVRRMSGVALIYGASILVFFGAEVFLASSMTANDFGQYSYVRNLLPLLTLGVLAGIDQALTRSLAEGSAVGLARRVLRGRLPLAIIAGLVLAVMSIQWFHLNGTAAISLAVSVPLLVGSELAAAVLRGHGSYARAAVVQQGYRLTFGGLVLLAYGPWVEQPALGPVVFLLTAGIALLFVLGVAWMIRVSPRAATSQTELRSLRRLGIAFVASMGSLLLLDWGDQVTANALGNGFESAGIYSSQKLVAVYPLLSIASVLGFMLMPELVRRRDRITRQGIRTSFILFGSFCAVLAGFWGFVSDGVHELFVSDLQQSGTMWLLAVTGALRLFYLAPSAILGALGSARLIIRVSIWAFVSVPVLPLTAVLLRGASVPVDSAVAGGLLAAVCVRVGIAVVGAWQATVTYRQARS